MSSNSNTKCKKKNPKTETKTKTKTETKTKSSNLEEIQKIQLKKLWESISKNYLFFIAILFSLYLFKQSKNNKSSYIQLFSSFLTISTIGHLTHYISHRIDFKQVYMFKENILTRNPYTNQLLTYSLDFWEFHHKKHHDLSINKQIKYIIYEFVNNVFTQGLLLVLLIKWMDIRVIILWAFFYATIHNINYVYIKPTTHRDHHVDDNTNFGIDFLDILFNTKYDWEDIEVHNHGAINVLIITFIILYFTA